MRSALGRLIEAGEENHSGQQPAVVLGYPYWQKRFGDSNTVVGKQVRVNGRSATVVGVVSKEFLGTQMLVEPGMYLPLSARAISEQASDDAWRIGPRD